MFGIEYIRECNRTGNNSLMGRNAFRGKVPATNGKRSRYNQLSNYCTSVNIQGACGDIKYRDTVIVAWNEEWICIADGNWQTVTTKRKMNQASNQFGLGFRVYQKKHIWYVTMPDGETCEYEDGMSFGRVTK